MASKKIKRPSIKDVAKLSGFSPTTVSFVINRTDSSISEETQKRVWAAVEELGYRPNKLARGLRSSRTNTIAFISDEIATTPVASGIIQGVQDKAWENDYIILMFNTGGLPDLKEAVLQAAFDQNVDGIIYATMYHREVHTHELLHELPAVLLDCFVADASLPSVVPDEVTGGRVATELLIGKGHRRIALINESKPVPAQLGRIEGYRQALAKHNIPFDENLIFEYDGGIPKGGYKGVMHLMNQDAPPTAFFCFNDRMAMGAYDALRNIGLAIPDDVAVVGFDNQDLIAADIFPGLTTMALPHHEMGQWAVDHLLKLITTPQMAVENHPVQKMLECPLIIRKSA